MFTVHPKSIDQMNESYIVSSLSCFDGNERYISMKGIYYTCYVL